MAEGHEKNEEVVQKIRELLEKYPDLGSRQLYDRATRMAPSLHLIGLRSFHARYVLPIKRERARAEGRMAKPRRRKATAAGARGATTQTPSSAAAKTPAAATPATAAVDVHAHARVREIVLGYARQIAAADGRAELVDLIGGIDAVVEKILHAKRSA